MELPSDPAVPLLSCVPERNEHTRPHKTCAQVLTETRFTDSQRWRQPNINGQMPDEHSVVPPYIQGMLVTLRRRKFRHMLQSGWTLGT